MDRRAAGMAVEENSAMICRSLQPSGLRRVRLGFVVFVAQFRRQRG
jgi:hypothetical protein